MTEVVYSPAPPPQEQEGFPVYLQNELIKLSQFVINASRVPLYFTEPSSPVEGQLASADGTGWDPGSGVGFYIFTGGSWVFIV